VTPISGDSKEFIPPYIGMDTVDES